MRLHCVGLIVLLTAFNCGCQCCPLFDCYANAVDDASDTHFYFDHFYNPHFDITRMGKPDWCCPMNSHFCRRCCNNGCYDRYDECNLYAPLVPYEFPSNVMPPPTVRTKRVPRKLDLETMLDGTDGGVPVPEASVPGAPLAPAPTPSPSY